jgi:hypothetical protein
MVQYNVRLPVCKCFSFFLVLVFPCIHGQSHKVGIAWCRILLEHCFIITQDTSCRHLAYLICTCVTHHVRYRAVAMFDFSQSPKRVVLRGGGGVLWTSTSSTRLWGFSVNLRLGGRGNTLFFLRPGDLRGSSASKKGV